MPVSLVAFLARGEEERHGARDARRDVTTSTFAYTDRRGLDEERAPREQRGANDEERAAHVVLGRGPTPREASVKPGKA